MPYEGNFPYHLGMNHRMAQVTACVVLASLLLVSVFPAAAQIGQEAVEAPPEQASWIAFVLGLLFTAAVGVGCLMSPKRTHQD